MAVATFPQPLYAKDTDEAQIIVLAVVDDNDGFWYLVMYNEASHTYFGKSVLLRRSDVRFEHFYWPEIEPVEPGDFQHPQEPALKVW